MSENEMVESQDLVYENLLNLMAKENDPEKLQKLAKALESVEKGRIDRTKLESDFAISESKVLNDKQIAERKATEEELDNKKRRGLEHRKAIIDCTVKVLTFAVGTLGLFFGYKEEIDSYRKNIETKREANNMLKNNK